MLVIYWSPTGTKEVGCAYSVSGTSKSYGPRLHCYDEDSNSDMFKLCEEAYKD